MYAYVFACAVLSNARSLFLLASNETFRAPPACVSGAIHTLLGFPPEPFKTSPPSPRQPPRKPFGSRCAGRVAVIWPYLPRVAFTLSPIVPRRARWRSNPSRSRVVLDSVRIPPFKSFFRSSLRIFLRYTWTLSNFEFVRINKDLQTRHQLGNSFVVVCIMILLLKWISTLRKKNVVKARLFDVIVRKIADIIGMIS